LKTPSWEKEPFKTVNQKEKKKEEWRKGKSLRKGEDRVGRGGRGFRICHHLSIKAVKKSGGKR